MTQEAKTIDLAAVKRGFEKPALESQRLFRLIMDAIAQPGLIQDLSDAPVPPAGINRATGAIALTLFDFETTIWLDPALRGGEVEAWLRFHCGCPMTLETREAEFAIITDTATAPTLVEFNQGDAKYPELSTTLIIEVQTLNNNQGQTIRGPGIQTTRDVGVEGLPENFWEQFSDNHKLFQFGVDVMLTHDCNVMGLPRTVQIGED